MAMTGPEHEYQTLSNHNHVLIGYNKTGDEVWGRLQGQAQKYGPFSSSRRRDVREFYRVKGEAQQCSRTTIKEWKPFFDFHGAYKPSTYEGDEVTWRRNQISMALHERTVHAEVQNQEQVVPNNQKSSSMLNFQSSYTSEDALSSDESIHPQRQKSTFTFGSTRSPPQPLTQADRLQKHGVRDRSNTKTSNDNKASEPLQSSRQATRTQYRGSKDCAKSYPRLSHEPYDSASLATSAFASGESSISAHHQKPRDTKRKISTTADQTGFKRQRKTLTGSATDHDSQAAAGASNPLAPIDARFDTLVTKFAQTGRDFNEDELKHLRTMAKERGSTMPPTDIMRRARAMAAEYYGVTGLPKRPYETAVWRIWSQGRQP